MFDGEDNRRFRDLQDAFCPEIDGLGGANADTKFGDAFEVEFRGGVAEQPGKPYLHSSMIEFARVSSLEDAVDIVGVMPLSGVEIFVDGDQSCGCHGLAFPCKKYLLERGRAQGLASAGGCR